MTFEIIRWIGATATVAAALMVAAQAGARLTRAGFALFCVASVAWIASAAAAEDMSLLAQNLVLLVVNVAGVLRSGEDGKGRPRCRVGAGRRVAPGRWRAVAARLRLRPARRARPRAGTSRR